MSTVQSESIVGLFGELCDLHLGETKRCHLVQPRVDRSVHYQHLRRRAFDCLFNFLKSPDRCSTLHSYRSQYRSATVLVVQ